MKYIKVQTHTGQAAGSRQHERYERAHQTQTFERNPYTHTWLFCSFSLSFSHSFAALFYFILFYLYFLCCIFLYGSRGVVGGGVTMY